MAAPEYPYLIRFERDPARAPGRFVEPLIVWRRELILHELIPNADGVVAKVVKIKSHPLGRQPGRVEAERYFGSVAADMFTE